MSSAHDSRPDQPPSSERQHEWEDPATPVMSRPAARRRGRLLVPALILLAFVVIFLIILLVGTLA